MTGTLKGWDWKGRDGTHRRRCPSCRNPLNAALVRDGWGGWHRKHIPIGYWCRHCLKFRYGEELQPLRDHEGHVATIGGWDSKEYREGLGYTHRPRCPVCKGLVNSVVVRIYMNGSRQYYHIGFWSWGCQRYFPV